MAALPWQRNIHDHTTKINIGNYLKHANLDQEKGLSAYNWVRLNWVR